jgi:hypothetical protein
VSLLACGPAITAQTQTPATAATTIRARITRSGKLTEGGSERQPYIARPLRVQVRKDWTVATLLRASPSWQARPVAYLMRGRPAPRAVYTVSPATAGRGFPLASRLAAYFILQLRKPVDPTRICADHPRHPLLVNLGGDYEPRGSAHAHHLTPVWQRW